MSGTPIRSIRVSGLYDRLDLAIELRPTLNVLHGRNGAGKTTLLHIIANLLEGDVARFGLLRFGEISVTTYEDRTVVIRRIRSEQNEIAVMVDGSLAGIFSREVEPEPWVREELLEVFRARPVYVPAFRSILEAAVTSRLRRYTEEVRSTPAFAEIVAREQTHAREWYEEGTLARNDRKARILGESVATKTLLCRDWFGHFVPSVRFPSMREAEEELGTEWSEAALSLGREDRESFQNAFVHVLRTVFSREGEESVPEDVHELLDGIRESLSRLEETQVGVTDVYEQITSVVRESPVAEEGISRRILSIYHQALRARVRSQDNAFAQIEQFESSVNRFLTGKQLVVGAGGPVTSLPRRRGHQMIALEDGRLANLGVLSSGERHVVTLLFSATHMSAGDGVLLIDEPELSLHVGWQRMILAELMSQAGDRQVIACTHAPEVAANHREALLRLDPQPSDDYRLDLFAGEERP